MTSPRERLENIVASYTPAKVSFKPEQTQIDYYGGKKLVFKSEKSEEMAVNKLNDPLQDTLREYMVQTWNSTLFRYFINSDVPSLFVCIKDAILKSYNWYSPKCKATKRKTETFIREISLEDKHLSNYLFQMFIDIKLGVVAKKSNAEIVAYFAPLESLRKTYGKRS